jgi:hypothetical protein
MEQDDTIKMIIEMGVDIEDTAIAIALAHDAKPAALVAALIFVITKLNLEHTKPGLEGQSVKDMIQGIEAMHADMVDHNRQKAIAEADEARQRGGIQ